MYPWRVRNFLGYSGKQSRRVTHDTRISSHDGMVDIADLKSAAEKRVGSNPTGSTGNF